MDTNTNKNQTPISENELLIQEKEKNESKTEKELDIVPETQNNVNEVLNEKNIETQEIKNLPETEQINIIFDIIDDENKTKEEKIKYIIENIQQFNEKYHKKILKLLAEEELFIPELLSFKGLWREKEKIWTTTKEIMEFDPFYKKEIQNTINELIQLSPPLEDLSEEEKYYSMMIPRQIGFDSQTMFERLSNPKKKIRKIETLENQQIIEDLFDKTIFEQSKKINEGHMGTIHLITPKQVQENMYKYLEQKDILEENSKEVVHDLLQEYFGENYQEHERVVKTLKVFDKDAGEKEFKAHQEVYNLIKEKGPEYAKIPQVYLAKEKKVTESLKNHPLYNKANSVYFLTMDFINGRDFLSHIYAEIIKSDGGDPENKTFKEMEQEVQEKIPDWEDFTSMGVLNNEEEREAAIKEAGTKNIQKIKKYCKKKNISIPQEVYSKVENTINELHENNWYHRDLHARNIMVDYDEDQKIKDVFLIDFGTTEQVNDPKEAYRKDDLQFVHDTEVLNIIGPFTH